MVFGRIPPGELGYLAGSRHAWLESDRSGTPPRAPEWLRRVGAQIVQAFEGVGAPELGIPQQVEHPIA